MSVYLYHAQVFDFLELYLGCGLDKKMHLLDQKKIIIFNILASVVTGAMITWYFEDPARKFLQTKRLSRRDRQPLLVSAVGTV